MARTRAGKSKKATQQAKRKAKPEPKRKPRPKARPERAVEAPVRTAHEQRLDDEALVARARTELAARQELIATVKAESWKDHLVGALGTFDDPDVFALVRDMAAEQLELPYHETEPQWLFALGELAQFPRFTAQASELLLGGFERLAAHARNVEKRELVNSVAFGALAHALTTLPADPRTGPALREAFRVAAGLADIDAHYELNVTCGPIAVALAAVDHGDALPELDLFLAELGDTYRGEPFVMQVLYGKWLLERDPAAALAYVVDPAHTKGLGYAAAALADLHHVDAYEPLAARAGTLEHPVAQEAFAEALVRLSRQSAPPPPDGRMIWLFGRRSPTEQALGEDSDNVFVLRAIERTRHADLGVVTEADDSAPED